MPGPLDGVRVLDVTTVFSGPYAALLLGDLGADVVKVEPPGGDIVRRVGPSPVDDVGPVFLAANRNKRSLCLDLRHPDGRPVLDRLIGWADVVLHNMRPAAAARAGLDPESVLRRNPTAVHCALIGFGSDGPYRDLPAYDDVVQAAGGLVSIQTPPGEDPTYVRSAIVDKIAGLATFGAVSAALVQRARTGEGVAVEVPMLETLTSFVLLEHLYGATYDPPTGQARYERMMSPDRRPYRTADGWLAVVCYDSRHWQAFFDIIGKPELGSDPRFADQASRTANTDVLYGMLAEAMPARTTAAWLELLRAADVPAMPVTEVEDLADDEHLRAVGLFRSVDAPGIGRYTSVRNPLRFSTGVDDDRLPPPRLGEHTADVLAELGYDEEAIAGLLAGGAVRGRPTAG